MPKTLNAFVITTILLLLTTAPFCFSQSELPKNQAGESTGPTNIYIIGSGDILEIVTWKEPDFTREEVIVRIDGNISFPLLDDVMAAGKTPTQLKFDIQNRLSEYVAEPHVTVTVRNAASKRFYILGEVGNTGEYPLVKNLTALQAFASAGGFTEWASKKEILVFRRINGKDEIIRINYKKIVKGEDFEQNVQLMPDDTIIVP